MLAIRMLEIRMLANMRFEHKIEGTQKKALNFWKFSGINLR